MSYLDFLARKAAVAPATGLVDVPPISDRLFPFQRDLVRWALRRGRAAIFADTGLGKTGMSLEWSRHVLAHTGQPVLILAPLAVAAQTVREGAKFGIEVTHCRVGADVQTGVNITNYDRLHLFDANRFGAVVLDESSCLKDQTSATRNQIIELFAATPFKLACTATPAPNDFTELGNHAEFLGVMSRVEMLSMWFVHDGGSTQGWRLKAHAVDAFWQWVCSWGAVVKKPSALGYDDGLYDLPPLEMRETIVSLGPEDAFQAGSLFAVQASDLNAQRAARRSSLSARVQAAAEIVAAEPDEQWLIWCELNQEGDELEAIIPGAVQVAGSDSVEVKESRMLEFADGRIAVMVSKPSIFGYGCNMQKCARMIFVGVSHCYDAETELLTVDGWKTFDKVRVGDTIGTVNPQSRFFEWQQSTGVVWSHYSGDLVRFSGRAYDLVVTPNHRMWSRRNPIRYPGSDGVWEVDTAEQLRLEWRRQSREFQTAAAGWIGSGSDRVQIPRSPHVDYTKARTRSIGSIDADVFAALAGWYLSEGCVITRGGVIDGRIVICQTDHHPDHRERIIDTLKATGLPVNHTTKDIHINNRELAHFLADELGLRSANMRIPRWLKDWPSDRLRIMWDAIMAGDGMHSDGKLRALKSTSPRLIADCQEVAFKLGISTTDRSKEGEYLTIRSSNSTPSMVHRPELVPYVGMVGCVTVPNGLLVVRRNGHAIVSGNSFENFYQAVRRCWRFGQERKVICHVITSEGEGAVLANLKRKELDARRMGDEMARYVAPMVRESVGSSARETTAYEPQVDMVVPDWLEEEAA